ncbi:MAG: BatA domain-containing protein [Armatimonadetes bacterium]|nr:BatA domain-containing protein [Akkermansiaceae bacterium]
MFFFNPWLLAGLAGVSIPILIHLIRQQAAKPIEWGAMRFLFDTVSVRRRKMEWEDLLLMATRCLLIGLVALAVARPFITPDSSVPWLFVLPTALLGIALFGGSFVLSNNRMRWIVRAVSFAALVLAAGLVLFEKYANMKRFEASGRRDVALVIDASTSMELLREGKSGFEIAIAEAKRVVNGSPRGTAFTVVLGGPAPEAVTAEPLTHRADVLGILNNLAPVGGTFRAHEALGMATIALAEGRNSTKEIIVFTDSQRAGWRFDNPSAWRGLETVWKALPTPPKLFLRNIGTPANFRNIALNDFELSRTIVGTDREVVMRALVQNTGEQAITPGHVAVEVDGRQAGEIQVGLVVPGQSETIEFRHKFEDAGPRVVQLRIDAKDDLEADNQLSHVVNVRSKLPVLIVEGNPSGSFFERASGYTALALAPSRAVLGGEASGKSLLMDPRVVKATSLQRSDLDNAEVIILADVQRFQTGIASDIARRVADGAGLITIAGPRADPAFYNAWDGLDGYLIPMRLEEEATDSDGVSPAISTFDHESVKIFGDSGDLKEARVTRWRKTKPHGDISAQAAAFSNGDTFIAARNYGNGRTLLFTCALDARAGALPAKRSFVPLIHESTTWAAGLGADLNVDASWNPGIAINRNGGGLLGEYYIGKNTRSAKLVSRVDPAIDFKWDGAAPIEGLPNDSFVIHWNGQIIAPVTGQYKIFTEVVGNIVLKIDGSREMNTGQQGSQELGGVDLVAGKPTDISVKFSDNPGDALVRLYWIPPGGTKEIIPASALIPGDTKDPELLAVTDPIGSQRTAGLKHGRRGQELVVNGAAIPGVYLISMNWDLNKKFPEVFNNVLPLVVNRDAEESSFVGMTDDDLNLARSAIDLILPKSVKDILAVMQGKGFGREIWKLLAMAALILFILESILARWVSRSRRTTEDVRVDFGGETAWRGGFR